MRISDLAPIQPASRQPGSVFEADIIPFPGSPKPQTSVPSVSQPAAAKVNPWTGQPMGTAAADTAVDAAADVGTSTAQSAVNAKKAASVIATDSGMALVRKVLGKLVIGYGVYADATQAWDSLIGGDWRSAIAWTVSGGLNVGELFGVIAGPVGLAASVFGQIAAILVGMRMDLFELHYGRPGKTNDPTDEAMAAALIPIYAQEIYDYLTGLYNNVVKNMPSDQEVDAVVALYKQRAAAPDKAKKADFSKQIYDTCQKSKYPKQLNELAWKKFQAGS